MPLWIGGNISPEPKASRKVLLQTAGLGPGHINEKNLFFSKFDCFPVLSATSF